jgi:hypothetical protein
MAVGHTAFPGAYFLHDDLRPPSIVYGPVIFMIAAFKLPEEDSSVMSFIFEQRSLKDV